MTLSKPITTENEHVRYTNAIYIQWALLALPPMWYSNQWCNNGGQGGALWPSLPPSCPPLEFVYNIANLLYIYNGPCPHCPPPCGIVTSGVTREGGARGGIAILAPLLPPSCPPLEYENNIAIYYYTMGLAGTAPVVV